MTTNVTQKPGRIMGPIDYLIIRFPGNKFSGKIAPELLRLEREGIINVIDLVFLMKDENGKLGSIEPKNLEGEVGAAFRELSKKTSEWFTEPDIEVFADSLPKNCSAALLMFENVWAIQFKKALLEAEAELVDMGRIPPEVFMKAERELVQKGGN